MNDKSVRKTLIAPYNAHGNKGDEELTERALDVARASGDSAPTVIVLPGAADYKSHRGRSNSVEGFMRYPLVPGRSGLRSGLQFGRELAVLALFLVVGKAARVLPVARHRKQLVQEMLTVDRVIFKGGGYCHSYGPLRDAAALVYLLHMGLLCRRLDVRYGFLPNSYGPFRTRTTPALMRRILAGADFIYSRESLSTEALKSLNDELKVRTVADMAFAVEPLLSACVQRVFGVATSGREASVPVLGLTARPVRPSEASNPRGASASYIESLRGCIRDSRANGIYPVLVTHVADDHESEDDRRVLAELEHVDGIRVPWINEPSLSARELAAVYGLCDVLVATRFHSAIFAAASGTPSVVIRYGGNKALGTLRDMGLAELSVDLLELESKSLFELVNAVLQDRESIEARLKEWVGDCRSEQEQLFRDVANMSLEWGGK